MNCNLKFGREGTLSDNALGVLCNLAVESKLEQTREQVWRSGLSPKFDRAISSTMTSYSKARRSVESYC